MQPKYRRDFYRSKIESLPSKCKSLADVKALCKYHNIKNSVDYKHRQKDIPGLVSHPERMFADEWVSWNFFLDTPGYYLYSEVKMMLEPLQLSSQAIYKKFVKESANSRFPLDPQGVYVDDWENWYKFLSKEEPFKVGFIQCEYSEWGKKIDEFMKQALGGGTKLSHLCRFVRIFIEKHDKSKTPQEFLTKDRVNIKPFRNALEALKTDNMRRNVIISVNEFLDFIIDNDLTMEDEETGEIVRILEARNPFSLLLFDKSISAPIRSETTKPCLQYHFVKKAQKWIAPETAKFFKDLKHLQIYDADWIKVSESDVDKSDRDCVYKTIGRQYYLWSPIDWMHTLSLTRVPLRGRQIAYNDSGEADDYIADIDSSGNIIWIENQSDFAGMTKKQSFIKKLPDGHLGMFTTTNKTSNDGNGYTVPWFPEDLAYWMVKLRRWQQKYNSIAEPSSWSKCKRTHLNEMQLKAKGINCFLFRAYGDFEPKNVGQALTARLAAALYNIQPSDLILATLVNRERTLSHYKSKYTPHSMRVSLITAYIMEMGMPVEVVMKIVGHSSILMSIYYCKITGSEIRRQLEEGEKISLKLSADATQKMIEQNKLEEVKNNLIANNQELLDSLTNDVPAGNFMFRDYGLCPYAASRCEDGGDCIGATNVRQPVPAGYLGVQNCLRCRHFITGPAFVGGLISVTNEILLQSKGQSKHCSKLQREVDDLTQRISICEREEYISQVKGSSFDTYEREMMEKELRKIESEYESAAKKVDMLLCDAQASYKLIKMSLAAVNKPQGKAKDELSLVKMADAEMVIDLQETSNFRQLQEVCENATIYQSASAENAITPRSQLLDRMAQFNSLMPTMFMMSQEQQLKVGNQLVKLLYSRLKSWQRVDQIIEGDVKIEDLIGDEQISLSEIELVTQSNLLSSVV